MSKTHRRIALSIALLASLALIPTAGLAAFPPAGAGRTPVDRTGGTPFLAQAPRPPGMPRSLACGGCRDAAHGNPQILAYAFSFQVISHGSWLIDSAAPGRKERRESTIGYGAPRVPIDATGIAVALPEAAAAIRSGPHRSLPRTPPAGLWAPRETRTRSSRVPARGHSEKLGN